MPDMAISSPVTDLRRRVRRCRGRYRELSTRARLSYSWVSQFASGARGQRPAFDTLQRLGDALDAIEADDAAARRKPSVRVRRKSVHAQKGGQ